jgi:hypothetical protein
MKKNLVMLLCAVSLLANTVQAESAPVTPGEVAAAQKTKALESGIKRKMREARHSVGGFFAPAGDYLGRAYGGSVKSNWFGVSPKYATSENAIRNELMKKTYGQEGFGPLTEGMQKTFDRRLGEREALSRHLTGRVPYGVSHASRLVNALLLADVLGRDTNSFIGRGLGNVGRRLGFHRKAKDWRRGAYNAMTNGKWYGRGGRALTALALAGLSDAALARMVGDSSAVGAGYRNTIGRGWNAAQNAWNNREVTEAVAKDADTSPLFGDEEVDMDSLKAGIARAEALDAEIAGFKDLPKGHGGLWKSSDRKALLAAQGALSPNARKALSEAGELRN